MDMSHATTGFAYGCLHDNSAGDVETARLNDNYTNTLLLRSYRWPNLETLSKLCLGFANGTNICKLQQLCRPSFVLGPPCRRFYGKLPLRQAHVAFHGGCHTGTTPPLRVRYFQ